MFNKTISKKHKKILEMYLMLCLICIIFLFIIIHTNYHIDTLTDFLVTFVFIGTPISGTWYLALLELERDYKETKNNLSHKIIKPPLRIILSLLTITIGFFFIHGFITEPSMPIYSDIEESVRISRTIYNFFALICGTIITFFAGLLALCAIWGKFNQ